ncbi:MAG: hypothetical protein GEV12_19130 [Micromonosporaceae bacterium]|nr:hypothetical protein [Micromonosporaceae bacterium]
MDFYVDVYERLDGEWAAVGSGPEAREAVKRWAVAEPALAGFEDLAAAVERCREPGATLTGDTLLAVALRFAGDEPLAARVALQVLLPALDALATRARSRGWCGPRSPWKDMVELDQEVLVAASDRVIALSGQRFQRPAVVILRQVWRQLRGVVDRHRSEQDSLVSLDRRERLPRVPRPVREPWVVQLTRVLCDAVRDGVVRRQDAALIFSTRVMGVTPAEVGRSLRLPERQVWQRRRWAERRLFSEQGK